MDTLQRLERWYQNHCDGDWEHQKGIRIGTIDNPGWSVDINLTGTELQGLTIPVFKNQDYDSDSNWVTCWIEDQVFHGRGDQAKLEYILKEFLSLAEKYCKP